MPVLQNSNFKPIKSSYCSLKTNLRTGRALFVLAPMQCQRRQRKRCLQHVPCPGVAGTRSGSRQGFSITPGILGEGLPAGRMKNRACAAAPPVAQGWHPPQQSARCRRAERCSRRKSRPFSPAQSPAPSECQGQPEEGWRG